jgi:hypothetical protein
MGGPRGSTASAIHRATGAAVAASEARRWPRPSGVATGAGSGPRSSASSRRIAWSHRYDVDPHLGPQARVQAFLTVPLYKALFENYRGFTLPRDVALEQQMVSLGVATKQKQKARQAFQRSAEQAGFFAHGRNKLVRLQAQFCGIFGERGDKHLELFFKIDHPLDPENKYLSHSFVESPDMMNIYNGNVVTDASGYATVTLPDYQGVGIGNALSDFVASLWSGLGFRATSTTTHPAMIRARLRSPHWIMHRPPGFASAHEGGLRHATHRLTAGFRYVGPALPRVFAKAILEVD